MDMAPNFSQVTFRLQYGLHFNDDISACFSWSKTFNPAIVFCRFLPASINTQSDPVCPALPSVPAGAGCVFLIIKKEDFKAQGFQ